jgi:methylthioribose-1-phosphate isomerase
VRTIDYRGEDSGRIVIIDQRLLPGEKKLLEIRNHQELITAIQTLAIRGAPALGVAGAFGVALIAAKSEAENWNSSQINAAIDDLRSARPTAVNLAWGVDQVRPLLDQGAAAVLDAALEMSRADGRANRAMGKIGAAFILGLCGERKLRPLTHCNTGALATTEWGTALGVIAELHQMGCIEEVYADETRPLLQGSRLTAWELGELGISYRILPDGAAASALFSGAIDVVLIGADRIARNGDSANKIGSLSVAIAAKERNIPFFVVAPESTIDRSIATGADINIEFRDDTEVTHIAGHPVAPIGAKTYNPAFDVTPARYITGIVTEKKVYQPRNGEGL